MATESEKNWNRPWSMQEMIGNAETWSLAGDVALLNTLKAYSEKLFKRTADISDNVDDLLHGLDEVGLRLNISQNVFQSLRNTQFIESRVYEDDETLDVKEEVKLEEPTPSEEQKEKLLKESVSEGLHIMDKYFEKVEVCISDSDDEESDKSYIMRAKDIYAHRPLPFVIGTKEWYKNLHVGLADSSSESESGKVSETYSESDSEDDLPKDLMKGSETSSELDFSSRGTANRPVANSTFNESTGKPDIFASDEESEGQGSLPAKTPISSRSFAEQLAAKLGDVISEREDVHVDVNRKPIQPAQKSRFAGDLFSDEPPPLDDLDNTILPKSAEEGLFSGGRGLFDDKDDESFWGQQNKRIDDKLSDKIEEIKEDVAKTEGKAVSLPKSSQVSKGLFDSDSNSEDDIFAPKLKQATKPQFLKPFATTAPLFDEEPPELDTSKKETSEKHTDEILKKKPVGGVSIFGKPDIFSGENVQNILKTRQKESGDSDKIEIKVKETPKREVARPETLKPKQPNLFDEEEEGGSKETVVGTKRQKISLFDDDEEKTPDPILKPKKAGLFDDDDDFFKEDLFSGITTKKFTSCLFDDIVKDEEDLLSAKVEDVKAPKDDLFSDSTTFEDNNFKKSAVKPKKALNLFSDAEEEEEPGFLNVKPKLPEKLSKSSAAGANNSAVSSDTNKEVDGTNELLTAARKKDEVDQAVPKTDEDLPERRVIGTETLSADKKAVKGLFDDSTDDTDSEELFKGMDVKEPLDKIDLFGENRIDIDEITTKYEQDVKGALQAPTRNAEPKSTINLFGSTPPPDDEEWDTKSVQSLDNDEQFSYPLDYNVAGSSLFDNEPPSLGPNESSGIVRDQNVTSLRVDTDGETSFNPYASSSRRLSSDVFSDQQSQDSFFVSKSKTESINVLSQLDSIPEAGKASNLDITPSGNLEDLEYSKTTEESSVFQASSNPDETATSASKKSISLFDDEFNDKPEEEDFFSSITKKNNAPGLSEKRLSLFDKIDDVLDVNVKREDASEKVKTESIKTKTDILSQETEESNVTKNATSEERTVLTPPRDNIDDVSDDILKKENPNEKEKNDAVKGKVDILSRETEEKNVTKDATSEEKTVLKPPIGSPGKLKHNLKINVGALMPGSAPPNLRGLKKSHSLDLPKDQSDAPTQALSPDVGLYTPAIPVPPKQISGSVSEKAVSFEDSLNNVEVLHSVTRDRAKIPIKRRPSTRRGRKQAIEDTTPDYTLASGDAARCEVDILQISRRSETPPPEPPPLHVEQSTTVKIGHGGDVAVFGEEKSIFDSEDSDSELFGGSGTKKAKKESADKKREAVKKKSLFNDSSSDEDLFSGAGSSHSKKKEGVQKAVGKKIQKQATRKLENIEADKDPLSSLLK